MKRTTRHKQTQTFYVKDHTDLPLDLNELTIQFPFKSKQKYESIKARLNNKHYEPTQDLNPVKQQKKFQRPYYSPHFLSYEADLVFFTSKTNKPLKKNIIGGKLGPRL